MDEFMRRHTLRSDTDGAVFRGKGAWQVLLIFIDVQELLNEHIEGTYVMTCGSTDTEVRYTLNAKKVVFNEVNSTLFLIRDTTHAERAYRKLVEEKYRGVLLSTITHELKTPLTIMSGNLELLSASCRSVITPEDQAHLEAAMLAAKSLKYYLHDINVRRRVKQSAIGHKADGRRQAYHEGERSRCQESLYSTRAIHSPEGEGPRNCAGDAA